MVSLNLTLEKTYLSFKMSLPSHHDECRFFFGLVTSPDTGILIVLDFVF